MRFSHFDWRIEDGDNSLLLKAKMCAPCNPPKDASLESISGGKIDLAFVVDYLAKVPHFYISV